MISVAAMFKSVPTRGKAPTVPSMRVLDSIFVTEETKREPLAWYEAWGSTLIYRDGMV